MEKVFNTLKNQLPKNHARFEAWLSDLVAIPGVSSLGFRSAEQLRAAHQAALMKN